MVSGPARPSGCAPPVGDGGVRGGHQLCAPTRAGPGGRDVGSPRRGPGSPILPHRSVPAPVRPARLDAAPARSGVAVRLEIPLVASTLHRGSPSGRNALGGQGNRSRPAAPTPGGDPLELGK